MAVSEIRFDDGASYERYMGTWSRLVGDIFLTWLAPSSGLRWIDIGCGNGAFTEQIVERCAPAEVQGIDPSEANSSSRAHARLRAWRNFARAMPWRCRSRTAASTPRSWRW
jgi:trans-aconitate methyltransferase